jgi:secretion/DNA translocation related TadE-like protein
MRWARNVPGRSGRRPWARGRSVPQRERGSGTVAVLGAVGVILAMTVGALFVVSAVVASHRAQSAADLAALAAAAALVRGEPSTAACATGAGVAARNGATVSGCRAGADLSVELVVELQASAARAGTATARSRAGPANSGGAG